MEDQVSTTITTVLCGVFSHGEILSGIREKHQTTLFPKLLIKLLNIVTFIAERSVGELT